MALESFTAGQAARVETMVRTYEDRIAEQKVIINRLLDHLKYHCPELKAKPGEPCKCKFHQPATQAKLAEKEANQ